MKIQRYAWVVVGLLWGVALLNYLDRQAIYSQFPLLQKDLGLSNVQLGLLSAAFLWVYGALSPFAGFLADRFGRVPAILFSLLVWSLVTWATGHAHSFSELVGTRALMGVSEAFYFPAALGLIADYHGTQTRSLATGLHQSGLYVGIILSGVGAGWAGQHYGWRLVFSLMGIIGLFYFAILALVLKRPEEARNCVIAQKPRMLESLHELLALPGFLGMTAVFGVVSACNWLVWTWLPLYLYQTFHMSLTKAGFSATFYIQVACCAGIVVGGWIADHWRKFTPRGRLLTQAIGLSGAAVFLFLIGLVRSETLVMTAMLAFGIGRGFYETNAMPVLCQIARRNLRSTGYGLFNCAGSAVGGLAAVLAGHLKGSTGLSVAFEIAGVFLLLSSFLLARIRFGSQDVAP
jgi:MFS family permease